MATKISIRKANAEDIPEIQRLYRQLDRYHADLLPGVFQPVGGDARPPDVVQTWIVRDDAAYLLAEADGKVIGFVSIQKASHPTYPMFRPHGFAMIENAVVDEPYRGHGVGKMLVGAATRWAKERGLQYLQTSVWSANARACEFWRQEGFEPLTVKLELDVDKRAAEHPAPGEAGKPRS
jgi:ribosomal protein S18 acetylase RimI-like enzyme